MLNPYASENGIMQPGAMIVSMTSPIPAHVLLHGTTAITVGRGGDFAGVYRRLGIIGLQPGGSEIKLSTSYVSNKSDSGLVERTCILAF